MKKIIPIILCIVFLCGCPGNLEDVSVDVTLMPAEPKPGDILTVKSSDRAIFEGYEPIGLVNFCVNTYEEGNIYYHRYPFGGTLIEKKSDYEAVFQIKTCSTGVDLHIKGSTESKKCGYIGWYEYEKSIRFDYPQYLTLDKTSAKAGDKVTVTSSKSFFDEATFSTEKVDKLTNKGYHIVWYSSNRGTSDNNPDKKAVQNGKIDLDSLTPTSVTFTIPDDAITGTIHVLNECGFVVDGTNDIGLVGNVEGAYAYYSTATELTITK